MTFNGGQGACQAIEDVVVLAKCLGATTDAVAALRAYELRRFARVSFMQKLAWSIGRAGRWTNPFALRSARTLHAMGVQSFVLKKHSGLQTAHIILGFAATNEFLGAMFARAGGPPGGRPVG